MSPPSSSRWFRNFAFGECIAVKPSVGAADGLAQRYFGAKAQFLARSRRAGHVAVHRCSSGCGRRDLDINYRWQRGGDFVREAGDVYGVFGADVIGASGFSLEENGPKPDHQIGSVKIGAHRRAVSLDANRAIVQTIGDEV